MLFDNIVIFSYVSPLMRNEGFHQGLRTVKPFDTAIRLFLRILTLPVSSDKGGRLTPKHSKIIDTQRTFSYTFFY